MRGVLLSDLVRTSEAVSLASGRRVKIDEIAGLLRRAAPEEIPVAVAFLSGELRQRQIGVGYAALGGLLPPRRPGLGPAPGPAATDPAPAEPAPGGWRRSRPAAPAWSRAAAADPDRDRFRLRGDRGDQRGRVAGRAAEAARDPVHPGHPRRALFPDPAARWRTAPGRAGRSDDRGGRAGRRGTTRPRCAGRSCWAARCLRWPRPRCPPPAPRRGDDSAAPAAALAALRAFRLQVGRPLRPMLAASAPTVAAAFDRVSPAAAEWKIDGIRIQVHRHGPVVGCSPGPWTTSPPGCPRSPGRCCLPRRGPGPGRRGDRAGSGGPGPAVPGHREPGRHPGRAGPGARMSR